MKMPLNIQERRFPKTYLVDQNNVEIEESKRLLRSKIDRRNVVTHTFTTTGLEEIIHGLGRLPIAAAVVYQSAAANISGDETRWTKEKIFMRSSVSGITVKFQTY